MTTYPNSEENPAGQSSRLAEDSPPLPPVRPSALESPRRHPLKSFGLANFKAFGPNVQTIPLKPITLIFGPNSGGKSSILHYLLWMKDLMAGKGIDIHFPSAGGKSVDLGGFRQMMHGTNPLANIVSCLTFCVRGLGRNASHHEIEATSAFAMHRPTANAAEPALVRFELRTGGRLIFAAIEEDPVENPGNLTVKALDTAWLAEFAGIRDEGQTAAEWRTAFETHARHFGFDNSDFSFLDLAYLNIWMATRLWVNTQCHEESPALRPLLNALVGSPESFGTLQTKGLLLKCNDLARFTFSDFSYLGPLRAYPPRSLSIADLPTESDPEGLYWWRALHKDAELLQHVNGLFRQLPLLNRYEIVPDHNVSLMQLRQSFAEDIGRGIKALRAESACEISGKLRSSEENRTALIDSIVGHFDRVSADLTSDAAGTVKLRDFQTGKYVSSRDIGVGLSQLIPVLAQASGDSGLIAVEQPELHIHPALQAELGDVFIESAMKRGNTFLIETHSEHLILRLLRRIRETSSGTLEEGKTPLTPADIAVLYVEPGEGGSKVIEIPVGTDGDFDRPWPNGFFTERGKELF